MYKRGEISQRKKEMLAKLEVEHKLFKYRMLSGDNKSIYDACNKIRVYECLYEYFLWKEDINTEYIQLLSGNDSVLQTLYDIYLKYEYLDVGTWLAIDELLEVYKDNCMKEKE